MRWLLLIILFACADDQGQVKENIVADAAAESSSGIYNVYQFPTDELSQLYHETQYGDEDLKKNLEAIKFLTRLQLTATGRPDAMHIVMDFSKLLEFYKNEMQEEYGLYNTKTIQIVAKPIPIKPLPSLYILSSIPFAPEIADEANVNVYMSWNHDKKQIGKIKVALTLKIKECLSSECKLDPSTNKRKCGCVDREINNIDVILGMKKMPYDPKKAKDLYNSHNKFPFPADQYSILDMVAFYQLISFYQQTDPSSAKDLDFYKKDAPTKFSGEKLDKIWKPATIIPTPSFPDISREKWEKLLEHADEVVENFSSTDGNHVSITRHNGVAP